MNVTKHRDPPKRRYGHWATDVTIYEKVRMVHWHDNQHTLDKDNDVVFLLNRLHKIDYHSYCLHRPFHRDYKRIEAASGDEPRNKLNKSNGGQI